MESTAFTLSLITTPPTYWRDASHTPPPPVTLSPEEVADAIAEGVDAGPIAGVLAAGECFSKDGDRWHLTTPLQLHSRRDMETAIHRGGVGRPFESLIPLIDTKSAACDRVSAYWQARAAADALAAKVAEHLRAAMDLAEQHRAQVASIAPLLTEASQAKAGMAVLWLQAEGERIAALAKFYREAADQ